MSTEKLRNRRVKLAPSNDTATAAIGVAAGADVLVAGSAIFDHAAGVPTGMEHLQLAINCTGTS